MSIFGNLFGNKKAEDHIVKAGSILDEFFSSRTEYGSVVAFEYNPDTINRLKEELQAAINKSPDNPEYLYLMACAMVASGLGKTGFEQVRAIVARHPDFALARGLYENPEKWWKFPFLYPAWGANTSEVSDSIIPHGVEGCKLMIIRDGCRQVVSFFHRLPKSALGSRLSPSHRTAIRLTYVDTPYLPLVGAYVLIDTDPNKPYTSETLLNVSTYTPALKDLSGSGYWLVRILAQQDYTYVVLAEPSGKVYFNRKVQFDAKTRTNLSSVASQIKSIPQHESDDPKKDAMAAQYYMNHFSLDNIQF